MYKHIKINMIRLRMIWYILTKRYVSMYWREDESDKCEDGYETTARDRVAANMACTMCLWAKSRKYRKEQIIGRSCTNFEPLT